MPPRKVITSIPAIEGLDFEEERHIYRFDGDEVPSVSTILKPLSDAKYEGIKRDTLEHAAAKGTAVHNAIENLIKFGIKDLPVEYMPYLDAFSDWWNEASPTVVGSEIRLYHKIMRYAGTADMVAYIDGELTLVDYKTTYTISDMTCGVQLEAYAKALESMGVKVQHKMILQLKRDGRHEIHSYPVRDSGRWAVFGALKTVHDYLQANRKEVSR